MTEANNSPTGVPTPTDAFYNQYYRMPAWVRHEVMHMAFDWRTGDFHTFYRERRRASKYYGLNETPRESWEWVLAEFKRDDTKDHIAAFPGMKAFMGQFPC